MGRAFEFRKARKLKRWGNMAKTFTRIGKQIAIAVKAGGPDPDNNSTLRAIIVLYCFSYYLNCASSLVCIAWISLFITLSMRTSLRVWVSSCSMKLTA